jgi:hypothetical protein
MDHFMLHARQISEESLLQSKNWSRMSLMFFIQLIIKGVYPIMQFMYSGFVQLSGISSARI